RPRPAGTDRRPARVWRRAPCPWSSFVQPLFPALGTGTEDRPGSVQRKGVRIPVPGRFLTLIRKTGLTCASGKGRTGREAPHLARRAVPWAGRIPAWAAGKPALSAHLGVTRGKGRCGRKTARCRGRPECGGGVRRRPVRSAQPEPVRPGAGVLEGGVAAADHQTEPGAVTHPFPHL